MEPKDFLLEQLHEMYDLDEDQYEEIAEGKPIREVLPDFDEVALFDLVTETSCEYNINIDSDDWLELYRKEDFNLNHLLNDIKVFQL